mmetsp:Transcript_22864/g.71009  ORF Transcript_22864/g.71009 Transcript_22864/m.71009 type:complete len:330 (-) Transcript_22864:142-1131(-)
MATPTLRALRRWLPLRLLVACFFLVFAAVHSKAYGETYGNAYGEEDKCETVHGSMPPFTGKPELFASVSESRAWLEPFVVEKHKLVFCKIAKNGSSGWLRLLRRLDGFEDWELNPYLMELREQGRVGGLKQLKHYGRKEAAMIMTDPTWTKVALVREPLERLLSAYLDKISGMQDAPEQLKLYSSELFGWPPGALKDMPFSEFVDRIAIADLENNLDDHWAKQHQECGLGYWGPLYDKIIYMKSGGCSKEEMMKMLVDTAKKNSLDPLELDRVSDTFQVSRGHISGHATHKGNTEWYTEEVYHQALQVYGADYAYFNLTIPERHELNGH